ncbi:MAG: ribosome recycling factor [Candidatus Spechtbacterales bacterium]
MTESELKQKLEKALGVLNSELSSLRVGKANASIVENVMVEAYGSQMELQQVAAITTPQHNQILIEPWDKSLTSVIEKALLQADLGMNPIVEGDSSIRMTLPPLTEERRKDLVREAQKHGEETRVVVRNVREDAMNDIDDAEKNKEISEDEKFKKKDDLEKVAKEYNQKVDEVVQKKEKDIMEQ